MKIIANHTDNLNKMIQPQKKILILIVGLLLLSSCASKKDVLYFNDINLKEQDGTVFSDGKIQANDILSIVISSSSPELASIYNTNQPALSTINGYLVTIEGAITLPILGKIKVKDLTLLELENLLVQKLIAENHLSNATVTVRLTNAKFTILGEVKNPGTFTFNEQNISLLQALGYAGDLTINGQRQDVLIIREENNKRTYTTIDLTSKKWFDSPYYYIKPNDVIYVNPNGPKVTTSGYVPNLTNLLAVVSIAITTVILLTK
ncbi:polysaccharide export protein [Flavobacterium franklandianum]|uniref:Polysaccharide export protein n=1 Tax=Flavobacterium bomense TaxID=2497483 RepID=A0A432CFF0_9FLAO|nr:MULTISPECIES: polysaccharide biosynthesis/export family protein [Flavobacterium]RTZ00832.1 polysaccharide export protein [Flavobacterium bomense]TRX29465.1 polysaccharide export protein [Flavobacterium franklandianum]